MVINRGVKRAELAKGDLLVQKLDSDSHPAVLITVHPDKYGDNPITSYDITVQKKEGENLSNIMGSPITDITGSEERKWAIADFGECIEVTLENTGPRGGVFMEVTPLKGKDSVQAIQMYNIMGRGSEAITPSARLYDVDDNLGTLGPSTFAVLGFSDVSYDPYNIVDPRGTTDEPVVIKDGIYKITAQITWENATEGGEVATIHSVGNSIHSDNYARKPAIGGGDGTKISPTVINTKRMSKGEEILIGAENIDAGLATVIGGEDITYLIIERLSLL